MSGFVRRFGPYVSKAVVGFTIPDPGIFSSYVPIEAVAADAVYEDGGTIMFHRVTLSVGEDGKLRFGGHDNCRLFKDCNLSKFKKLPDGTRAAQTADGYVGKNGEPLGIDEVVPDYDCVAPDRANPRALNGWDTNTCNSALTKRALFYKKDVVASNFLQMPEFWVCPFGATPGYSREFLRSEICNYGSHNRLPIETTTEGLWVNQFITDQSTGDYIIGLDNDKGVRAYTLRLPGVVTLSAALDNTKLRTDLGGGFELSSQDRYLPEGSQLTEPLLDGGPFSSWEAVEAEATRKYGDAAQVVKNFMADQVRAANMTKIEGRNAYALRLLSEIPQGSRVFCTAASLNDTKPQVVLRVNSQDPLYGQEGLLVWDFLYSRFRGRPRGQEYKRQAPAKRELAGGIEDVAGVHAKKAGAKREDVAAIPVGASSPIDLTNPSEDPRDFTSVESETYDLNALPVMAAEAVV